MKVVWSSRALRSLADIHQHIASNSEEAANQMVDKILKRGDGLATFPQLGRTVARYKRAQAFASGSKLLTAFCIESDEKELKSSMSFTRPNYHHGNAERGTSMQRQAVQHHAASDERRGHGSSFSQVGSRAARG